MAVSPQETPSPHREGEFMGDVLTQHQLAFFAQAEPNFRKSVSELIGCRVTLPLDVLRASLEAVYDNAGYKAQNAAGLRMDIVELPQVCRSPICSHYKLILTSAHSTKLILTTIHSTSSFSHQSHQSHQSCSRQTVRLMLLIVYVFVNVAKLSYSSSWLCAPLRASHQQQCRILTQ